MSPTKYDVVVIGAGISGIGTAYWLQKKCPTKSVAILEARATIGGTWSLFNYPGIRSDSDMFTFGYRFKPWENPQSLSSGTDILNYLKETVNEFDLERLIRYNHKVTKINWSDNTKDWEIETQTPNGTQTIKANFISICSGYYDYKKAHRPVFKGENDFKGKIIEPQFWPKDIEIKDKKFAVIGSGATAITLVPSLVKENSGKVTMVQRSPTYVMNLPNRNGLFMGLKKILPNKIAYRIARINNILLQIISFSLSKAFPKWMKKMLLKDIAKQLPNNYPVSVHFNPKYNPWDQRLCVVPDGDLFKVISQEKATIITDNIKRFTENGLEMNSGKKIEADYIVMATGLKIQLLGGAKVYINEKEINITDRLIYKGMMVSDVPNLIYAFGYTNASWTLKVDLTANYLCKLINHMDKKKLSTVTPQQTRDITEEDFLNLSSGYIQRAKDVLPKQGLKRPWRVYQNYIVDMLATRFGGVNDSSLKYT